MEMKMQWSGVESRTRTWSEDAAKDDDRAGNPGHQWRQSTIVLGDCELQGAKSWRCDKFPCPAMLEILGISVIDLFILIS